MGDFIYLWFNIVRENFLSDFILNFILRPSKPIQLVLWNSFDRFVKEKLLL